MLYINEMCDYSPFQSGGYVFDAQQFEDFGLRFSRRGQDLVLGVCLLYSVYC